MDQTWRFYPDIHFDLDEVNVDKSAKGRLAKLSQVSFPKKMEKKRKLQRLFIKSMSSG